MPCICCCIFLQWRGCSSSYCHDVVIVNVILLFVVVIAMLLFVVVIAMLLLVVVIAMLLFAGIILQFCSNCSRCCCNAFVTL